MLNFNRYFLINLKVSLREINMELNGAILRNFYNVGSLVTKEIINDNEYFSLKIPHYQRPYKWTKEHVERLILDWHEHKHNHPDSKYFAGSIVTVASDGDSFHSLIDGQQRYTTLFLANFINFLLLRLLILDTTKKKRCGDLVKLNKEFKKCIKFLFSKESQVYKDILDNMAFLENLEDEDMMESYHEKEDYSKVCDILILPTYKNELAYRSKHHELLKDKLNPNSFNLSYDRSSFNEILYQVISQCFINYSDTTELLLINLDEENLNENEKVYTVAIDSLLTKLKELNPIKEKEDMRKYVRRLQSEITDLLNTVNLCVIQTTNADDAYTLFEVMNDRALALDDLDLIKNQFFKSYVTKANKDNDEVDKVIQKLDDQWINNIFHHNDMSESYKKLVTYYATVYITGNKEIKNGDKFRTALANYLSSKSAYSKKDIQTDFNIFQTVFKILTELKLPYQKREGKSLVVENDNNSTSFTKTMFFLNAMKQEGVISGLVNLVLSTIESFNPSFDIEVSNNFIKLLIEQECLNQNHTVQLCGILRKNENIKHLHSNIQEQSKILWKDSMLSKDAISPRKLSIELIEDNHLLSNSNHKLKIKNPKKTPMTLQNG